MQNNKADESRSAAEHPAAESRTIADNVASTEVHVLLHQLNQPLTAISNYARAGSQLIESGMADTARLKELFEKIATQSGRTTALSQELGIATAKLLQGK